MSGRRRACPEQTVCVWCDQEPAPTHSPCVPSLLRRPAAGPGPSVLQALAHPSWSEVLWCEHPSILCPGPRPRRSKAGTCFAQHPACQAARLCRAPGPAPLTAPLAFGVWVGRCLSLQAGGRCGSLGASVCVVAAVFFFFKGWGQGKSLILKPQAWVWAASAGSGSRARMQPPGQVS